MPEVSHGLQNLGNWVLATFLSLDGVAPLLLGFLISFPKND